MKYEYINVSAESMEENLSLQLDEYGERGYVPCGITEKVWIFVRLIPD